MNATYGTACAVIVTFICYRFGRVLTRRLKAAVVQADLSLLSLAWAKRATTGTQTDQSGTSTHVNVGIQATPTGSATTGTQTGDPSGSATIGTQTEPGPGEPTAFANALRLVSIRIGQMMGRRGPPLYREFSELVQDLELGLAPGAMVNPLERFILIGHAAPPHRLHQNTPVTRL